jgi:hypothetical protein
VGMLDVDSSNYIRQRKSVHGYLPAMPRACSSLTRVVTIDTREVRRLLRSRYTQLSVCNYEQDVGSEQHV